MILQLKNVFASYGLFDVIKDVNMYVQSNEIVCMIGPNGSGKSTVLKTVFGFLKANPGQIIFNGEDITGQNPVKTLKKGISYVFQEHSIFPKMTVLENLEMGAYIINNKTKIKQEIHKIFTFFPVLKERTSTLAGYLSGGQQRILEIGRALMLKPILLLLDEPTIGLSPLIINEMFQKIIEINSIGTTILMVEQNAKKALGICNRAYVLENGYSRLEGRGQDFLKDPEVKRLYLGGK